MNKSVEIRFGALTVKIEKQSDMILTDLGGGLTSANWPHPDEQYKLIAEQCGFTDLLEYCFEHEILHSLLPIRLFGHMGYTVSMSAMQKKGYLAAAMAEERLIYYVQTYIAGNTPLIDEQWKALKEDIMASRRTECHTIVVDQL